jgi:hypothetical protein
MLQAINILIGTAWTLCGLLCIGMAIPLITDRVGRNPVYGVRFRVSIR